MASPLGLTFDNNQTKVGQYRVVDNKAVKSLFGNAQFSPYPSAFAPESGSVTSIQNASDIHKDEMNDISVTSIIEYTEKYTSMKLTSAHFAYLRNLGVYPNNRLIIARRFASGVGNDLTAIQAPPLATIVSYVPESEDFFQINFGEEWDSADASFEDVLNEIGDDVLQGDNKGGKLGGLNSIGLGMIPFPALMEGLQWKVMEKMGLAGGNFSAGNSPYGNPNIIRQAMMRKVPKKGEASSGLAASFSVKVLVEYEQKFINGLDPTLVYMDLIQNALTFGTSDAVFEYSSAFAKGTTDIIGKLISGDITAIFTAIVQFVESLIESIAGVVREVVNMLVDPPKDIELNKDTKEGIITDVTSFITQAFKISYGTVISKYKVRLTGIAHALTGSPSAPWHVTIGNPKKPLFSSGDLLCDKVDLKLGKVLAFNDLPSTITIEFTLTNARPLGAQEIFNRFNTGRGRSYTRFEKSFNEVGDEDLGKLPEEIKKKLRESDAEKEKQLAEKEKAAKANNGTNNSDKSAGQTTDKNSVIPPRTTTTNDDYRVTFTDNNGSLWGIKQSEPPQQINKVGDSTTVGPLNSTETKPSNQSSNDPNTPTSNIPPATSPIVTTTVEIPGASSSVPLPESLPEPPEPPRESELVFGTPSVTTSTTQSSTQSNP